MSRQKHYFFIFHFIDFDDFLTTFAKNLMKRPPAFMIDIKSLYKLLLSHKDLRSRNIWQWNDGLLNIFKNLYGNTFSLFIFIKRKSRCNVPFNDTYKMCCYHLFYIMKIEALWNGLFEITGHQTWCLIFLVFFFTFSCLYIIFAENFMKKLSLFNINFWNSFQDLLFCQVLRSQTWYY